MAMFVWPRRELQNNTIKTTYILAWCGLLLIMEIYIGKKHPHCFQCMCCYEVTIGIVVWCVAAYVHDLSTSPPRLPYTTKYSSVNISLSQRTSLMMNPLWKLVS